MEIKEEDVLLCTVKKIEGVSVFLELPNGEKGTMVLSEVAAGRIRNLREYVSPDKKVVCKVLKIAQDHIELSLRRVTAGERKFVLEKYKKERTYFSMLKAITKNPEEVKNKIEQFSDFVDFFDEAKSNPQVLEKILSKQETEKITSALTEKQEREKEAKCIILLSSNSSEGVQDIKELLSGIKASISYLGSSKFLLSVSNTNPKEAEHNLAQAVKQIEVLAKQRHMPFSQGELKK